MVADPLGVCLALWVTCNSPFKLSMQASLVEIGGSHRLLVDDFVI